MWGTWLLQTKTVFLNVFCKQFYLHDFILLDRL